MGLKGVGEGWVTRGHEGVFITTHGHSLQTTDSRIPDEYREEGWGRELVVGWRGRKGWRGVGAGGDGGGEGRGGEAGYMASGLQL